MLIDIQEPGTSYNKQSPSNDIAIGIDLGTTYSLAAMSKGNKPTVITSGVIPSAVSFAHTEVVVGQDALNDMIANPESVIMSVKRLMGRGIQDLQKTDHHRLYQFDQGQEEHGAIQLQLGNRVVTPIEVSSEILKTVKQQAESALKQSVFKAVITVPAYFDDAARLATKDAARLAGIEVLRLVNEPTAAALAYGLDSGSEGLYAIYDLGGGTFDFSLLNLRKGVFQVLATAGDTHLGGDDFDLALLNDVMNQNEITVSENEYKKALHDMRALKEQLSVATTIKQQGFEISRDRFDALIRPLIEKSLDICEQALADAQVNKHELKGIVLVGGSTRIPLVQAMVKNHFNQDPLCTINPDQVVALGAALQAEALTNGSDTLLLDITPLSLGLETMGGLVDRIIERNSPIPISQSKVFTTYQDGQTGLQLHVVQGEREMATDCRSLARFELKGIPSMRAGDARVRVQFSLDADGLLTVVAREELTGIYQHIEVKPSYGLSEAELEAMLKDSFQYAKQDVESRLLVEARLAAKKMLGFLASGLEKDGHLLEQTQSEAIEIAMDVLENQLTRNNRSDIEQSLNSLKQLIQPFIETRLNHSLQSIKGKQVEEIEQNLQNR
jgi:molecular chaperone HscA